MPLNAIILFTITSHREDPVRGNGTTVAHQGSGAFIFFMNISVIILSMITGHIAEPVRGIGITVAHQSSRAFKSFMKFIYISHDHRSYGGPPSNGDRYNRGPPRFRGPPDQMRGPYGGHRPRGPPPRDFRNRFGGPPPFDPRYGPPPRNRFGPPPRNMPPMPPNMQVF